MALKEIVYNKEKFTISYEIKNLNQNKNIIFLHGWGSNKEIMKMAFKKCLKDFKHIYIDLPGFGKSSNSLVLSTKDYVNIVDLFLKEIKIEKDIIVGHSFGGKVAILLSPKFLVLLSSAGIVEKKPFIVKAKIAIFKILKFLKIKKIRDFFVSKDAKNMSENMYETFKKVVNESFDEIFKKYKKDVLIFWGKEDKATSIKSGEKIASYMEKSSFFPLEGDHYFFLKNADFICRKIKDIYEKL